MKPLLAFLLGFALLLHAWTANAGERVGERPTAADEIRGDVHPITDTGAGSWTEIIVTLHSTIPLARARLEVVDDQTSPDARVIDRRDVDLQASAATIHFPVLVDRSYSVRLVDDHDVVRWSTMVEPHSGEPARAFVMGVDPPVVFTPSSQPDARTTTFASLRAMPQFSWTYDEAALFMVRTATLDNIDPAACSALVSWIRSGGTLVLIHDDGNPVPSRCGLGPFKISAVGVEDRAELGRGLVLLARTKQLDSDPTHLQHVLASALERRTRRPSPNELVFVAQPNHALRIAVAAVVGIALALIVGPWIFRGRRRGKPRILLVLALTSVTSLVGMFLLGRVWAAPARTTTMTLRDFTSGESTGRAVHTHVFYNPSGPVRTHRAFPGSLLVGDAHGARGAYRIERDGTIVLNEAQPWVTDQVYLVESVTDHLPGAITIQCSYEECRIDNATGVPLEGARLYVAKRGFFDVGTVAGKKSVRLEGPQLFSNQERFDELYAHRSGTGVSLIGHLRGEPAVVGVACVTGCEALQ